MVLFDGSILLVRASDGGAMNRGEGAGGRVRNTHVAVLSDAGLYEKAFGILWHCHPTCQRTRRRSVVVVDEGRRCPKPPPGVSVRMVRAGPHRPTIRRTALSFGLWCHALFAEWFTNRHQQARCLRMMALVHNLGPSAPPHRYCAQQHAHETSGTILRNLRLEPSTWVARRFWNR